MDMQSNTAEKQAVLVFARIPSKGKVKKRLARVLGETAACELYRAFVSDLLKTLDRSGFFHLICHTPETKNEKIAGWLEPGLPRFPQKGSDLGDRMAHAFEQGFSMGYRRIVLVGTDLPDLPESVFHNAFDALSQNQAVLGPALDGGYYLIGFSAKGFDPFVFKNISWGTARVLKQTLARFALIQKKVHLLFSWNDIDTIEDLKQYIERHALNHGEKTATIQTLDRLNLLAEHAKI